LLLTCLHYPKEDQRKHIKGSSIRGDVNLDSRSTLKDVVEKLHLVKVYKYARVWGNSAKYPEGGLGEDLASIARLIKGGLGTEVYGVSLSGFDTHANQLATQPGLLK